MSSSDAARLRIFGDRLRGNHAESGRIVKSRVAETEVLDDARESALRQPVAICSGPTSDSLRELDDETLLLRMQAADMDALAEFFRRHSSMMLGIARRVLRNNNEAEDLVQDVFLSLLFKSGQFDPAKGAARPWLIQVTYHRAYDRRRYLNARSFYDSARNGSAAGIASGAATEDPEQFYAWRSHLRSAFEELSEDQYKTLTLYFYEGYTIQEISERLGQSFGNVQHHYYRGMDRLRKYGFGNRQK